jgi:hypothetical protein
MKLTAPIKLAARFALLALLAGHATAKLPPPSDEAKAKAAEAAAKTAHGDKVAAYQLCKSQDNVAMAYQAAAKKAGKPAPAPTVTPPCADPGPFVYAPAGAASAAPPAPAVAAAPAAPGPVGAKK